MVPLPKTDTLPVKCAFLRSAILVFLMLIGMGHASGQAAPRTVPVAGTVLDPSGAGASGAVVTLKQSADKSLDSTVTDDTGRFRFAAVPDGSYIIDVQHQGFAPSLTPLRIRARAPAPLVITLALAGLVSEVTVNESELAQLSTEVSENHDSVAVDQNLLQTMPVFDQDYVTAISAFLDAGSIGTSGAQLIVNGVAVTTLAVSSSAIQEVRINQNPYSADMARPGRGSIEIITKDPTPQYHGTINFTFRDAIFNARDPFAATRAPEQRRIWEGAMTGPVGGSKTTSFLLSGHRQEEDLDSIVYANGPTGLIQENVASPKRDTQLSTHIEHRFSSKHTIFGQYNEWDYPSYNQGVGGFVLPEAATNQNQWEREWVYGDRWAPSPKWLSQFQFLVGWEHHETVSVTSAPKIIVQDAFTSGGAQVNLVQTEKHVQANEMISWSSGKHFVKFGLNIPDWSLRGIDNHNNFAGTYTFTSLAAYANQTPATFKEQSGIGHVSYWQQEFGLFVQDDYRVGPGLSLSLGLRYNWQNVLRDRTQFAPRFAFAYSPGRNHKTVLRGGAGIFYDRTGAGPLGDLLLYNGQVLQSFLISNPSYPNPGSLGAVPSDITQLDPAIREPYSVQYSIAIERQLAKHTTLAVTYYGSVGENLFRSRDINAPLTSGVVPNPAFGVIREIESSGRQNGNSLEVTLRGDLGRYFSGLAQYTLSRTDNNTGGVNWFPANQYDLSGEWGRADFDQRHRLNLLEGFKPGKQFTLGVGVSVASGKPYSLTTGLDAYHTGLFNARPAGVSRNTLEGPTYADLDLRLSRDFFLSKKKEKGNVVTFSLDAFNILNHVNYTAFVGNLSSAFFGQAVAGFPARRLQLTSRFKF